MKINTIKDASCPKCGLLENVDHLIYECEYSEYLWSEIETWINSIDFTNS